jgi:hypothetical protein
MRLNKKLKKAALAGLSAWAAAAPFQGEAQSIEGHISSSGGYPRLFLPNIYVEADSLGSDTTDGDGYYQIPGENFVFPRVWPDAGGASPKYDAEIFDLLGRRVGRLERGQRLEDLLRGGGWSSGRYFKKGFDPREGVYVLPFQVVNQNIAGYGRESFLRRVDENAMIPGSHGSGQGGIDPLSKASCHWTQVTDSDSLYILTVSDDNIPGIIGAYYDFVDTLTIPADSNLVKNVRLIKQYTIGTQYYQEGLELFLDLETFPTGNCFVTNYGEYPNNPYAPYPQRVFLDSVQAYQYCSNPQLYLNRERAALDSINRKTGLDLFREVNCSDSANITMDYTQSGGSQWRPIFQNFGGLYYLTGGVVQIKRNLVPLEIYPTFCHELAIHGLGFDGHGDDPNYISHSPIETLDFAPEEIETIKNHVLQYHCYVTGPGYLYHFVQE